MKKLIIVLLAIYSYVLVSPNITYAAQNCSLWGVTVKDWFTIEAFKSKTSNNCGWIKKTRQCVNGNLTWDSDYKYLSCDDYSYLPPAENIEIWGPSWNNNVKNKLLDDLKSDEDIKVWNDWEKSILYFLFTAAKDLKTVFYIISGLYFLILVIKLLFSNNTEDEVWNFKKWVLWISLWILLMQISFYFVNILYAQDIWWNLANTFTSNVMNPLIKALETAASFFFMLIAIYAFYRIITADWDEEKVKTWKMSILYWLIGFVVIKVSKEIVSATYWKIDCNDQNVFWIFQINGNKCNASNQLSWISETVVNIINWMNGFVWIIVIIMIIYVGVQVYFEQLEMMTD